LSRRVVSLFALIALPFCALACSGSTPQLSHVFVAPPWQGAESYNYNLLDQGNNLTGTCVLKTVPGPAAGQTQLEYPCGNGSGDTDNRLVIVDAKTLTPVSSTRTTYDKKKNSTTTVTSEYSDGKVELKFNDNGTLHSVTRQLPGPTKDSPDPGYYDDAALFWVVRGIPLQKGWQGAYTDINASASGGQVFTAALKVEATGTLTVPAGTFQAYRIQVETNSITQHFWVNAAAPHQVLRAQIEDTVFELSGPK
jgi:uncharacterized protein DUF3108